MSEPVENPGGQNGEIAEADRLTRQAGQRRFNRSYLWLIVLVLVAAAVVLELIPANDYILLPGQALPVAPMIAIRGHPLRHKAGSLYLTDVSLYKADHLIEVLWGHLNADSDIEPAPSVSGGLSDTQFNAENLAMMSDSIREAEAAALSQVPGDHPHYADTGPLIIFVLPHTPASRVLRAGDVVLSVNGHRTKRAAAILGNVKKVRPGESLSLRLLRHHHAITVSVQTIHSTDHQPNKRGKTALIGIDLRDQLVFPIKISVNPGDIGGPSAGFMFSLGIIQRLVPQDITHGCRIAGTGTIDAAGNIGPIGGAAQKIVAAENAGAKYFLVPAAPENLLPARAHAHNITVVPVTTLPKALSYLARLTPCR